jgi:3-oxoacyl-(acyl-carrier-protein) synthase
VAALVNLAAGQIAVRFGAKGPNSAVATACTTGAHAIGDAFRLIQHGYADAMICGGTEAASRRWVWPAFPRCAPCRRETMRPNARAVRGTVRDGFVVGEGAGILILEDLEHATRRDAPILAELVGYGMTADAHHVTAPPEDGEASRG